jgi:hypothetical protein
MGLEEIRVKVDRAKEHSDCLKSQLGRFVKEKPYPLHVVTYDYQTAKVRDVEWTKRIPPKWGAIVGDCVHNLRSALDHIVWELSGGTGHAPHHAEFPVFKEEAEYLKRTPKGDPARGGGLWKIEGINERAARTAIYKLQPFQRADPLRHPLWVVHELDRLDKHRTLQVVAAMAHDYRGLLRRGIQDASDLPPGWYQAAGTQSPFYRAETPLGTKTKVKVRRDLAIYIALPEETVGSHEKLDVLLEMLIGFWETEVLPAFGSLL